MSDVARHLHQVRLDADALVDLDAGTYPGVEGETTEETRTRLHRRIASHAAIAEGYLQDARRAANQVRSYVGEVIE